MINLIVIFVKGFACAVAIPLLGVEPWTSDWWWLIICFNIIAQDLNN